MKEFNCPDCNYKVDSCGECFRFKNHIKQSNIENKENKENKENAKEDLTTDTKTTEIKINYIPVSYPSLPFLPIYPYIYLYSPYYPDYYFDTSTSAIPPSCRYCPNHPSNGGTGICNCTLGTPPVY